MKWLRVEATKVLAFLAVTTTIYGIARRILDISSPPHILDLIFYGVIILLLAGLLGYNVYAKSRLKIFTKHVKPKHHIEILETTAQTRDCRISEQDLQCLNRFDGNTSPEAAYLLSSWIGAKSPDRVDNVLVKDPVAAFCLRGKIPIASVTKDSSGKRVDALRFKFDHQKGGWWTAAIQGAHGKAFPEQWDKNLINIDLVSDLYFEAKSSKKKCLLYVRVEDHLHNSSDGVILTITPDWEAFAVPTAYFKIDPRFYAAYNPYLEDIILKNENTFDPTQVLQIDFGCSLRMPEQSEEILLCNLHFR